MQSEISHPRMVHEYYVARVRKIYAARQRALGRLASRADAERYRDRVRRRIRACFRPLPERTPLNLRTTGRIQAREYRIEQLLYESRPGLFVTANLYLPKGEGPFPGVLFASGHSLPGKAEPAYQSACITLARMGCAVLAYDPLAQGERGQDPAGPMEPGMTGSNPCLQHNADGKALSLLGEGFSAVRAWDGIRSLDALLEYPQVDPKRIFMTGNSGGGTLTTWLGALDDRIRGVAPSCFVTSLLNNLENELPCDSEQCPPGLVAAGLDLADFLIARAPRPVLLLGQREDFFDVRGLEAAYQELRTVYRLLGAEENVSLHVGPRWHSLHEDAREAMYTFFGRHAGIEAPRSEPRHRRRSPARLIAAQGGQVCNEPGNRFFWEFIREGADRAAATRPRLDEAELRQAAAEILNLPDRTSLPRVRWLRLRHHPDEGFYTRARPVAVETEPGIQAICHIWLSGALPLDSHHLVHWPAGEEATLFLPDLSSCEDVLSDLAPRREMLLSLDVRGLGVSSPATCGTHEAFSEYGADYMYAAWGQMLGESYLGRRVHDVLTVLDLLEAEGLERLHLFGRGIGAILAAFAALLHPLVREVTLVNAPLSFHDFTQRPRGSWPLSCMPWGVLKKFDLPDVYRELTQKNLRILQPWDLYRRAMPAAEAKKQCRQLQLPAEILQTGC